MADAPSGGGSGWGPFEIILGLLLAIGLLSNIGGKGSTTPVISTPTTPVQTEQAIDTSANRCGLSITAPLSSQKVYDMVRLAGSVNGCNWKSDGTTALYAQVINSSGAPISDFVAVPMSGSDFLNTAFDANILFTMIPGSGNGTLILVPAVPEEGKSISVRIPLKFVRN